MPDQTPQEHPSASWLRRQWERIRHGRWRDVIIVSVEEGASNVAAGKYILQVNIAGRNLALPVLWIAAAMAVVVALLLYPVVKPIFWPAQMEGGTLRLAIADFGEVGANGRIRRSQRGSLLSAWLYAELQRTIDAERGNLFLQGVNIWHNTRLDTPRDIRLPVIQDDAAAARLAQRIAAQMVIYGTVASAPEGERLDLEFYIASALPDESNLLLGAHVLGRPLDLPRGTGDDLAANLVVTERLRTRAQALALLVTGLTQQILGRTQEALATFRQAETALAQWPDDMGKEVLYFLIGREALFLGHTDQAEQALLRAVAINPEYARGQAALGSTYYILAQATPPSDRLRPPVYLQMAEERHQLAVQLAGRQGDGLVEALARVALAKSYRLRAETAYLADQFDEARRAFTLVDEQLAQAIPVLQAIHQYRLLAQAYETQGAARLQEADIARRAGDRQQAVAMLDQARSAYLRCIDQGKADELDQLLDDLIVDQYCRPNLATVDRVKEQLEEQP
jgi:tetratricopeptide (TPR) repeat protein